MTKLGIDVSSWNGTIDWKTVADYEKVHFAILRVTEKGNKIDSTFEQNYKGCMENDIPCGVYKYSYATSLSQIKEEANTVIKVLNGRKLDWPVFLDIEDKCQETLSKATMESFIEAFREIIEKSGYRFAIYCGAYWYQTKLPESAKKYDCWLAAYPANDDGTMQERLRPTEAVVWQYSSKAKIPGISGVVDRNIAYKDLGNVITEKPNKGDDKMGIIEQIRKDAVDFAVKISKDNSHGYSQAVRSLYNITNPTSFDCSSLVCTAYYYAFIKNGLTQAANYLKANCSYTGNMLKMQNCGFEIVARNQTAHGQMVLGDIELNETHHTALAIDGDNIVHARSSEGTSNTIDDSGNEIRTQPWYLYSSGWTHRLRFTGKGLDLSNLTPSTSTPSQPTSPSKPYNKTPKWTGVVTASSLNVRTLPGTENPTCSFSPLVNGTQIEVCDELSNGWYYIKYKEKYGFVSGDYVKKVEAPKPTTPAQPKPITVIELDKIKFPTLKTACNPSGAAVGAIQAILKVPVTNKWDAATINAIQAFKTSVGLDGTNPTTGEKVWTKLMEHMCKNTKNNK